MSKETQNQDEQVQLLTDACEELKEARAKIQEACEEARDALHGLGLVADRASLYWLHQIETAIGETDASSVNTTIPDTIEELEDEIAELEGKNEA